MSDPNYSKLTSMHFYAWKNGLKTGMYYLRSRPAVDAIKFTLNVEELLEATDKKDTSGFLKIIDKFEHPDSKTTTKTEEIRTDDNNKYQKKQEEEEEGCINCGS